MSNLTGKNVLITGGAAGIGKIMGRLSLEKGASLIIFDIDEKKLAETKNEFSKLGKVLTFLVDVTNEETIESALGQIKEEHINIDVLINNAGVVFGKYFHEHTPAEIEKTFRVNALALMHLTLKILPGMLEQNEGHICNIASSAGLISNPKMSVYSSSKWAAVGWSDSLRLEMKQLGKNIKVTTVTPYYIDTGMFAGVRSRIPILKPEKAARKIISGIEKNRIYVSMPWTVHFVRFSQGILPIAVFDWFVGKILGVYKTMEHFTGHGGNKNQKKPES